MTSASTSFPFTKEVTCVGWPKKCLFLTSATVRVNSNSSEEHMNPLQALGIFLCTQALSRSTLEFGKNATAMRLLYAVALENVDQVRGDEDEKLEAICNICTSSEVQLQKIKQWIEGGDSQKALGYVDDTLGFLKRQKRKYCDGVETTPIEETPPLLYLNKKRKTAQESVNWNVEDNKTEFYEFVQRFKTADTGRISWKLCFEKGQQKNIKTIKPFNTSEGLRCHYNRLFK